MSEHTPGPWKIDQWGAILTPKGERLLVDGVALPCGNHPQIAEAEANARLIALSPRMFAVLNELYGQIDPFEFGEEIVVELHSIVDELNDAAEKEVEG